MDLDAFFVSVERVLDKSLINKPVIIGGTERSVIASCSYEARKLGLHSAMPIKIAKKICPHGIYLPGNFEMYSFYSKRVKEIIEFRSPKFEQTSIDEFYIDLNGMERFFGSFRWSKALRNEIMSETNLPISFGLATSKVVAKVATNLAKPNNFLWVKAGYEKLFFENLPVRELPMIGKSMEATLNKFGFYTLGDIQNADPKNLQRILGLYAQKIWKRANGIDKSKVKPPRTRKSISAERTFKKDIIQTKIIIEKLKELSEKITFSLRKQHFFTSELSIKIRYSDFTTFMRHTQIPNTNDELLISKYATSLFEKNYQKNRPIRLIGLRLSKLNKKNIQLELFSNIEKRQRAILSSDKIRSKYGKKSIRWASLINKKQFLHDICN